MPKKSPTKPPTGPPGPPTGPPTGGNSDSDADIPGGSSDINNINRLRGGSDIDGQGPSNEGGPNPPARQAPPYNRNHTLTPEQMLECDAVFTAIRPNIDFTIHQNVIYLVYQDLLTERGDINSVDQWRDRCITYLEEQGSHEIRMRNLSDGFISQVYHMLRLAGLNVRNWNLLVGCVEVDTSVDMLERMSKMVSACRYQGFDPSVILKRIVRSWMEGKNRPREEYRIQVETGQGLGELIYSNVESLIEDMTFLILIFLNRGAVISKISKKSARDFNSVLRMLVAKYNIRANEEAERRRRAEAIAPEVVTLPRIAACFAQLTTVLFSKDLGRIIVSVSDFPGFPKAFFSPMFPSVVRKGYILNNIMYNIHPQLILYAILNDNVLHARDRVTPLDQIWTYYLAAHNSTVLIERARIEQCDLFGITFEGYFSPVILNQRDHCIRRIRELRPHERMEDFISEMNRLA